MVQKRCESKSWLRKMPWSRQWQSTPVFLPEKFHGDRSLESYSRAGHLAGGEQVSQDGVFRLSHPSFVNNDYAAAEIV